MPVGTQLRDLFLIDVDSIGAEEVFEKLSPLLQDRYLDKVVHPVFFRISRFLSRFSV